jgi:hypothetical protein
MSIKLKLIGSGITARFAPLSPHSREKTRRRRRWPATRCLPQPRTPPTSRRVVRVRKGDGDAFAVAAEAASASGAHRMSVSSSAGRPTAAPRRRGGA